ncbi:MAG: 1-acyl-sn-glycerol-3-phosphate acyltransferase [Muribaculaceae bacterium]|nr:1-acyl-sn-glycerol-3-phosphate acyltransferase [Muribaculaceae bacterium]
MELIQINLDKILRSRLGGWKGKLIPGFLIRMLEKIIHQSELNELLRSAYPNCGSAFSKEILQHLNISVDVAGLNGLPQAEPFIFASNHPLGGLDGIALVAVLGNHYGDENMKVLVNDMLMNVEPLRELFLPVNKYGSQGRNSISLLNNALSEGKQLVMFPAGLVSRLGDDGTIADLRWQKSFVSKALEFNRRIVPVRFEALNSPRFYKAARRRLKSGLKFNIEQILLPSEIFRSRNKRFKISFGTPIDADALHREGKSISSIVNLCRQASDSL